jgi:hypothetical protein
VCWRAGWWNDDWEEVVGDRRGHRMMMLLGDKLQTIRMVRTVLAATVAKAATVLKEVVPD